jgi:hypothetical protein
MTILELNSVIDKWEQSSTNYTGNTLDGEKQGFLLSPHHPEHKSFFKITANIYITDPDTDFILDIDIQSIARFDFEGKTPTLKELYEVYLEVRKDWNKAILVESLKRDIIMQRDAKSAPYEIIEEYLQAAFNQAYHSN